MPAHHWAWPGNEATINTGTVFYALTMNNELREVADGKQCWSTVNRSEQGEGLIDRTYVDYRMKDILSPPFGPVERHGPLNSPKQEVRVGIEKEQDQLRTVWLRN